VEVVARDDPAAGTPFAATELPQVSVNRFKTPPAACDLTILILWGRLGTPPNLSRADGTPYASGTEWELETSAESS
jgi:hypothetical protein